LFEEFHGFLLKFKKSRELSTLERMKLAFSWPSGKDNLKNVKI